jgi:hypothetical protein
MLHHAAFARSSGMPMKPASCASACAHQRTARGRENDIPPDLLLRDVGRYGCSASQEGSSAGYLGV